MPSKQQEPTQETTLAELKLDTKNANAGNARGRRMLASSLKRFGAGRSILLDKHNNVIAGNATVGQAREAKKIKNLKIVDVTGDTLVAVRRTDLDINDAAARELAIADNRTSETGLEWSPEVLASLDIDLYQFWDDKELARVLGQPPELKDAGTVQSGLKYSVIVECESEQRQRELLERFEAEGLACKALIS